MKHSFILGTAILILTGCGGGSDVQTTYTAVRVFEDDSGIIKGVYRDRETNEVGYIIAPNAVEFVNILNSQNDDEDDQQSPKISDFPIIGKLNEYTIHEGYYDGLDTLFIIQTEASPDTFDDIEHGIVYYSQDDVYIFGTSTLQPGKLPKGTHVYSGVFTARDSRYPDWADIGVMDITANFSSNSFSIEAESEITQITGSGFIDNNSGQISSNTLQLNDYELEEQRDVSLLGSLGGQDSELVSGVWHTNEDTPIMSGAFAGHK